jgi:hypothetical protein
MNPLEIDVFNGDADGLFAAHQLRLAEPGPDPAAGAVVTGLKREIACSNRIDVPAGRRDATARASTSRSAATAPRSSACSRRARPCAGSTTTMPATCPRHPRLRAHIDTAPETCTSLIVDRELRGAIGAGQWPRPSATTSAPSPTRSAADAGADRGRTGAAARTRRGGQLQRLRRDARRRADRAGGAVCAAGRVMPIRSTSFATTRSSPNWPRAGAADLAGAVQLRPWRQCGGGAVFVLPDEGWSRRVLGSFRQPAGRAFVDSAFAVLKARAEGGYLASVRAPAGAAEGRRSPVPPLRRRRPRRRGRHRPAGRPRNSKRSAGAFEQHDWGR